MAPRGWHATTRKPYHVIVAGPTGSPTIGVRPAPSDLRLDPAHLLKGRDDEQRERRLPSGAGCHGRPATALAVAGAFRDLDCGRLFVSALRRRNLLGVHWGKLAGVFPAL